MSRPLYIAFATTVVALPLLGQAPAACSAAEQAVRAVDHEIWLSRHNHDSAAEDRLLDDEFIYTDDGGNLKGKREVLVKRPESAIHVEVDEQPQDFRVVFTNGVAILNLTRRWTDYDKTSALNWGATGRVTEVLTCKNGEWKMVVFHETNIPNKNLIPSTSGIDHLDDYVGHYRVGENGEKGDFFITRTGDKLHEGWGDLDLLPGKYDTFFCRQDGWVVSFVRDKSGKVAGILYTHADGQLEAKRVE